MIERYTSVKTVIFKIITDIGKDANYDISAMKGWIAEVMEKINCEPTLIRGNISLNVSDHTAYIPCPVYRTIAVTHKGCRLRYGADVRNHNSNRRWGISEDTRDSQESTATTWTDRLYINRTIKFDEDGNQISTSLVDNRDTGLTLQRVQPSTTISEYYYIDGDAYKFSFEEGIVEIDFMTWYLDCDNFPMIPDSAHLRDAMYYYVLQKMVGRGYEHPVFRGGQGFMLLKQLYEEAVLAARVAISFPSSDQIRSFSSEFVKLIPDWNIEDFYRHNAESIYTERSITRTQQEW